MSNAVQWVRSLIFVVFIYVMMPVIGHLFFPWALFSRRGAQAACKTWCRVVRWSAIWMVGLRTEVRGTPPTDEVLIAAKHQSFLDIILIFASLPAGKFIMKRELMYAPVIGQYALKIGCVPVDRGKRSQAIKQMVSDVAKGRQQPGQLIIYPQGTRIAPGVKAPYKVGTSGSVYKNWGRIVCRWRPMWACYWPRKGIMRKPGTAVVEFLPRIESGVPRARIHGAA